MGHRRSWVVLAGLACTSAGMVRLGLGSTGDLGALPRLVADPSPTTAARLCLAFAGAGVTAVGLWLGLVVVVCVHDLLVTHQQWPHPALGALRPRSVRVLVGAALVCAAAHPASAAPDHSDLGSPRFLPLPVRPVSTERPAPITVRVRPGACLWSLAAGVLGPQASEAEIDRAWRRLYAANRTRVGPDPDLLRPGSTLVVPDLRATFPPTHRGAITHE